jgi:hypothetical protein
VTFATTAPPTSLNWLTTTNYRSTGIDTAIIDDITLDADTASTRETYRAQSGPETELWKRLDSWNVYVDHTLDDGCFLTSEFTNKTVFRIGLNPKDVGNYYLLVGNSDWKSIQPDTKYSLTFKFDEESPWDVPTKGVQMSDGVYLLASFSDTTFWSEFVRSYVLNITKDGRSVTKISMAGTNQAFGELIRCQEYENANKRSSDPFAG